MRNLVILGSHKRKNEANGSACFSTIKPLWSAHG